MWKIKIAIAIVVAGSVFGGGFYAGYRVGAPSAATVQLAQKKQDVKEQKVAALESQRADVRHAQGEDRVKIVYQKIAATPAVTQDCKITGAMIHNLNEAGK
jgi:hypothetical protein